MKNFLINAESSMFAFIYMFISNILLLIYSFTATNYELSVSMFLLGEVVFFVGIWLITRAIEKGIDKMKGNTRCEK